LVLTGQVVDPTLHGRAFTLCHSNVSLDSSDFSVVLLDSSGVLVDESGVVQFDLVKLALCCNLFGLDDIESLGKLLLAVCGLLLLSRQFL
jgi:hypothetical protein